MLQQLVVGGPEGFDASLEAARWYAGPGFSLCPPHLVEAEVSQTLRDTPGVHVESLSVHRIEDGVCLHGVIELDDPSTDVEDVIRRALAIEHVMNRMVVKYGHSAVCPIIDSDQSFMWG
jgi:hypothetical protein